MPWRRKKEFPVVLTAAVALYALMAAGFLYAKEASLHSLPAPFGDEPPHISFTWSPEGAVDLKTFKAHLRITDDQGLDFTTYRLTVKEAGRTFDFPVAGVVGRDYDTDLSFSWLQEDRRMKAASQMTVVIEIADNRGHRASLTRVVPLRNAGSPYPKGVQERLDRAAEMAP